MEEAPASPRWQAAGRSAAAGAAPPAEEAKADAAEIYAAVKPSGSEPEWQGALPQLRPVLRPYQRRAVQWMVQRERHQVRSAMCNIECLGLRA